MGNGNAVGKGGGVAAGKAVRSTMKGPVTNGVFTPPGKSNTIVPGVPKGIPTVESKGRTGHGKTEKHVSVRKGR